MSVMNLWELAQEVIKEYKDNCLSCDLSQGSIVLPGGIIELPGHWIINHYYGQESFLGWVVLQPRYHRTSWTDLIQEEREALWGNIQKVDAALRQFWSIQFPKDPIERMYMTHFLESKDLHFHFHIIPRTVELGQGAPSDYAAWRIYELTDTWKAFPERYRIRDKEKNWLYINTKRVGSLMGYLRMYFWEDFGLRKN
jgi:diadenosine tetraphosphate (Ap4A) HIT family hydrolase